MSIGPRAWGEKKRFDHLPEVNPQPGDILICKEWSNQHEDGSRNTDALYIRTGQALFSRMRKGSMNSEHLAIAVTSGANGLVCEANGAGVNEARIDRRDKLVFRCNDANLRQEVVRVARKLAGSVAIPGTSTVDRGGYSWKGAKNSVLRMRYLGKKARLLLDRLYVMVYGRPGDHYQAPAMFCSEFVAACFEVAAMRLDTEALGVDPSAMSPKAIEGLLERSGRFQQVGRAKIRRERRVRR